MADTGKQQHTPGPWHVDRPRVVYRIRGPKGEYIMEGNQYQVQTEANADLIAAAPDMLDALKAALEYEEPLDSDPPPWMKRAHAAIRKAEGQVND